MRVKATLTLESLTQAPRTCRMELDVPSPAKAASRVLRRAKQEFPGARWASLVIVLEKLDEAEATEAA